LVKNRFFWRWQYIVYRRPPKPRNMLLISANSEKKNKLRDMMTPDLIFQITRHLKPRYVCRLMATSKEMLKLVDTDQYWERPALHFTFW